MSADPGDFQLVVAQSLPRRDYIEATLTINGSSLTTIFSAAGSILQDQLVEEMKEILHREGWVVERPSAWETPGEICSRLGISSHKFCYRIKHPECPKPFEVIRNDKGISSLRSHPALDTFLKNSKSIP